MVVDLDAAADLQPRIARQRDVRADADRHHHQARRGISAPSFRRTPSTCVVADDLGGVGAGQDRLAAAPRARS